MPLGGGRLFGGFGFFVLGAFLMWISYQLAYNKLPATEDPITTLPLSIPLAVGAVIFLFISIHEFYSLWMDTSGKKPKTPIGCFLYNPVSIFVRIVTLRKRF